MNDILRQPTSAWNASNLYQIGAPTPAWAGGELTGTYGEAVSGLSAGGGGGAGVMQPFTWQNPYEYQAWGAGAAEGAGFGGKLGSYLGGNANLFGAGLNMLSKGVGAYAGLKQLGLAEDALSLEKKRFKTNLANQTQSYNTQMQDRIAGRSYNSEAERVAALSAAQLPDPNKKKGG